MGDAWGGVGVGGGGGVRSTELIEAQNYKYLSKEVSSIIISTFYM